MRTKIKSALSEAGVPVFLGTWHGENNEPPQYIVYLTRMKASLFGGNEVVERIYTAFVDIWSLTDFTALETAVAASMEAQGFTLTESEDVPEYEGYHLSMVWSCGVT